MIKKHKKQLLISTLIIIISLGLSIWQWLLVDLPHPDELYQRASASSTTIYDRHGRILYQITDPHQGHHTALKLDDIPLACQEATIATEDATFYTNPGFDTWAMLRALLTNLQEGGIVSGASTITQQLARNLLFTEAERTEVSITRKLREVILAWRLTQTYNKAQILTLYLNETYYGNLAYGLEAASNIYFSKSAAELDLAECALLAGLPQSPAVYNPLENLPAAQNRQGDVLQLMVKHNFLTNTEATLAGKEKLQFAATPFPIEAPHFVMHIRGILERQFGLEAIYTQGLQVHTTLDLNLDNATRRIVQYHLSELAEAENGAPPRNVHNAAVIIMDPQTGEVLAMLGSPNYFDRAIDGNVNATVATRQPGSSIKPITYAAAFDPDLAKRYGYTPLTPATMMMDVRTAFVTAEGQPYVPQNYDRQWHGPVLLRHALANSLNLVAVKVLDYVGLEAMTDLARQMGITTFDNGHFGLALTLGGGEVKLLELTTAYASLAHHGRKVEPVTILEVTTTQGQTLYKRHTPSQKQLIRPETAYLITDILSDNLTRAAAFGQGSPLHLTRPAAAKTGTTTDFRDNWTVGYTPNYVTGVWTGNTDNEPMRHVSGISGAAPIWHDIMELIHQNHPVQPFQKPQGLVDATICSINGLLPSEGCRYTVQETFIAGTAPTLRDTWHKQLTIDRRNGLLASAACEPQQTLTRWFTIYPAEAAIWVAQNPTRQVPQIYSPFCPPTAASGDSQSPQAVALASNQGGVNPYSPDSPFRQSAIHFTSPDQGATYHLYPAIPTDKQKIKVAVQYSPDIVPESVQVFVNDEWLSDETQTLWQLTPGNYRLTAHAKTLAGEGVQAVIEITVE